MAIVTADGPGGFVPDDDYAKLSYYLWCVLKACGVDILQDDMTNYKNAPQLAPDQKHAIFTLATGKQVCIETVSYKTLFLASQLGPKAKTLHWPNHDNDLVQPPQSPATNIFLPIETAAAQMDTVIDKFRMGPGGMMQVTPSSVMVCNEAWCRTYWVEPVRRIQARHNEQTFEEPAVVASDTEIQALFVRSQPQGEEANPAELAGAMANRMAAVAKRSATEKKEPTSKFQSFTGTGNSLGTSAAVAGGGEEEGEAGVFDPATLPETPPTVVESLPTTLVAVRLLNGQRRVVKLNLTMTVNDLAAHVKDAAVATSSGPFKLVAGFPPKSLTHPAATLEEAGLKGAQVSMQKA